MRTSTSRSEKPRNGQHIRPLGRSAVLSALALLLSGCLDEPDLEDRWSRVDVTASNPAPNQTVTPGSALPVSIGVDVTFRSILTGFAVAELRASSLSNAAVGLHPDAPRLAMAQDIDRILASSVSLGRATRAVTGWDHLIQHIDFSFQGTVPAVQDSTSAGLFVVCYLGSGVEIERADGSDTLVVTPFVSDQAQILPVGLELNADQSRGF